MTALRYRFGDFTLAPARRVLMRGGEEVPLIPRYFDLLLLLIEKRQQAVTRQEIFDQVWTDVVVSDGALSQAIRTLRRTLGDDVREPKFIRTVSRHGYQFIWANVVEEIDDGERPPAAGDADPDADSIAPLVDRLIETSSVAEEEARDVAEQLHLLGTAEAVARLSERPDHAPAVAILRDTRWSVPASGDVPLLRDPEGWRAIAALIRLRLATAKRAIARRWSSAALA